MGDGMSDNRTPDTDHADRGLPTARGFYWVTVDGEREVVNVSAIDRLQQGPLHALRYGFNPQLTSNHEFTAWNGPITEEAHG